MVPELLCVDDVVRVPVDVLVPDARCDCVAVGLADAVCVWERVVDGVELAVLVTEDVCELLGVADWLRD